MVEVIKGFAAPTLIVVPPTTVADVSLAAVPVPSTVSVPPFGALTVKAVPPLTSIVPLTPEPAVNVLVPALLTVAPPR